MQKVGDFGFLLMRTPALPIENILRLNNILDLEAELEINTKLKELFGDDFFLEAIFLASKGLYEVLISCLPNIDIADEKLSDLIKTLYKYYSRMCSRPTPYGLFAAFASCQIVKESSELTFNPHMLVRKSRLDMGLMAKLIRNIEQRKEVEPNIRYSPNTSIYIVNDSYRYVEHEFSKTKRVYKLSSLAVNSSLQHVIDISAEGVTKQEIKQQLSEQLPTTSSTDLERYINTLIEYKFLASDVDICAVGDDHLKLVTARMAHAIDKNADIHRKLGNIGQILKEGESSLQVEQRLREELTYFDCQNDDNIIQCDLFSKVDFKISRPVIDEIIETSSELMQLGGTYENQNLTRFKNDFYSRYDTMEVPLVEVLDPEIGIGYGLTTNGNIEDMPLIEDVLLPGITDNTKISNDANLKLVLDKYIEFLQGDSSEIIIDPGDLEKIKQNTNSARYAETSVIMGNLLASSKEKMDAGDYMFHAIRIGNPYAGKMLGRFAASDEYLSAELQKIILYEMSQAPEFLLAEIAHLPDDRLANIIIRPKLTEYEIPYLSNSTVEQSKRILVSDLMVSVFSNQIFLRSKTLNRYIIPKLTNAHNTYLGVNTYKFLSDLQYDNLRTEFGWNWSILNNREYLPRVVYKKFILSRARWLFRKNQFQKAKSLPELYETLPESIKKTRYVVVIESDNELLVDLNTNIGLATFEKMNKKRDLIIHEFLGLPKNNPVTNGKTSFCNEIILPIFNTFNNDQTSIIPPSRDSINVQTNRYFVLGSEWIYFKVYCASKWQEKILAEVLLQYVTEGIKLKKIQKWFFIKYNDPKPHFRFRILCDKKEFSNAEIIGRIEQLLAPFINSSIISTLAYDTYQREIERYGASNIVNSESLFFFDSVAVLKSIGLMLHIKKDLRLMIALRSIDTFFDDFRYTLADRLRVVTELNESFISEFNGPNNSDTKLRKSLNDKFRKDRTLISIYLLEEYSANSNEARLSHYFTERSSGIRPMVDDISASVTDLDSLLKSYIHMSLNRIFVAKQRQHELVTYHFITKHYTSMKARNAE